MFYQHSEDVSIGIIGRVISESASCKDEHLHKFAIVFCIEMFESDDKVCFREFNHG